MKNLNLRHIFTCAGIMVTISLSAGSFAQNTVKAVNADGTLSSVSVGAEARERSLLSDLHPSVYLSEGEVKVREQRPVCLFTDLVSLSAENMVFAARGIEAITIQIDDPAQLGGQIDLSRVARFQSLRFVQVKSTVECTTEQLFAMLRNVPSGLRIILTVEIPS